MGSITTRDGTRIWYRDWGRGRPLVFSHGWPLNADAWDPQLMFFAERGYRCIAHDRRGHGRSSQPWDGNDMDHYADDLADLVAHLDLRDAVHVGHSTGGGEVARYLGRHGTERVAGAVLISAVPPQLLRTPSSPEGLPIEVFDGIRAGVLADRAQYFREFAVPFFGTNRAGAKVSQGILDAFWLQSMQAGIRNIHACVSAFGQTDFTADLAAFDVPTWILHGEDDQVVPLAASAPRTAKLVPGSTLKVYPGFAHGMCVLNADVINADLLAFLEGLAPAARPRDQGRAAPMEH